MNSSKFPKKPYLVTPFTRACPQNKVLLNKFRLPDILFLADVSFLAVIQFLFFITNFIQKKSSEMAAQPSRHRSKWSLDFSTKSRGGAGQGGPDLASPPGYSASVSGIHAEATRQTDPALRAKRSWDMALGPIKQAPMNLFIMWVGPWLFKYSYLGSGQNWPQPFLAFATFLAS